jgi:hypothetical protein
VTSNSNFGALCPYCDHQFKIRAITQKLEQGEGTAKCPNCAESSEIAAVPNSPGSSTNNYVLMKRNWRDALEEEADAGGDSDLRDWGDGLDIADRAPGVSVLATLISMTVIGQATILLTTLLADDPSVWKYFEALVTRIIHGGAHKVTANVD